jgi:hypothetical protein
MDRHTEKILQTYSAGNIIGEWHNAKQCTFDGRDLFVASLEFISVTKGQLRIIDVTEHATEAKAREWTLTELRRRAGEEPKRYFKNNY